MEKTPIFYCGEVDSQGGSKKSLLNMLLLLKSNNLKFKIFVGNEGWFTEELLKHEINYLLIKEPKRIQEKNKQTKKINKITNKILSTPLLIKNWFTIIQENKNVEKNIILNETRDLIIFFPYLFMKTEKTLWLRSEKPGRISLYLLNRVNNAISVSNNTKKNVKLKMRDKVKVIYNFLECTSNSEARFIKDKRITIAGSIQPLKGQKDAIEAISLLPKEFTLNIVGKIVDQNYYYNLLNIIKKYGLEKRVFFVGSKKNFLNYLDKSTDVVLMPSKTESFGRVAMEAMSLGIPVVAYNVGGLPEVVVNQKTGLLLNYKDVKGLSSALYYLTNDKESYYNMSKISLKVFEENFSSKVVLGKLKDVLY